MKTNTHISLFAVSLVCILLSCSESEISSDVLEVSPEKVEESMVLHDHFQEILDTSFLIGSSLIYNAQDNSYHSNDFDWSHSSRLPASTFKIPNSIIALETGVMESDTTIIKWDGEDRAYDIWEQDLTLRDAFKYSCLPCYQKIARSIGAKRMNSYLDKLEYPGMEVNSANIDSFWIIGNSRISQFEQIDFLKRLYYGKLNISERTQKLIKEMMVIEKTDNYTLSGKTGWDMSSGTNNGWFVGYLETKGDVYFFASNVIPMKQFNMERFSSMRKEITIATLKDIKAIM